MTIKKFTNEPVLMAILAIAIAAVALWAVSCGGGSSGGTPTSPSPSGGGTSSGTTINIVGLTGSASFNPNPVQVPSGGSIVWKNATGETHTLVMNDGTAIGTVTPNGTLTTQLNGSGGNFHCTIHPTMVGSINGASAPPPPTEDPSGGYDY